MAQCLSMAEAFVFVLMVGDSDLKQFPEDENNNVISELTLIFSVTTLLTRTRMMLSLWTASLVDPCRGSRLVRTHKRTEL